MTSSSSGQVYQNIGIGYSAVRRPDPRIQRQIDAALATFTLHHWTDLAGGSSEMRRVAKRQVILLFEPWDSWQFWLVEYFPECQSLPSEILAPGVEDLRAHLDVHTVVPVAVPADYRRFRRGLLAKARGVVRP